MADSPPGQRLRGERWRLWGRVAGNTLTLLLLASLWSLHPHGLWRVGDTVAIVLLVPVIVYAFVEAVRSERAVRRRDAHRHDVE